MWHEYVPLGTFCWKFLCEASDIKQASEAQYYQSRNGTSE